MVSPLAPQQFGQAPNFGQQLLGAVAQGQGIQQNRQALAAGDQAMQMRQQAQNQQVSEYDYMTATRRLEVINRLARHARSLPTPQEREQFKQSISPEVLQSVGIDPAQLAQTPVDDRGLDALIAQTQAVLPQQDQMQVRVQSSQVLDNGTTVQVLTDGSTRVTDPNGRVVEGDKRAQAIRDAQQFGVDLQSQRAGGRTSASIGARVEGGGQAEYVEKLGAGRGSNVAKAEDRGAIRKEEAQSDLSNTVTQADTSIRLIDELLDHPGRDMATGATAWVPPVPGTAQADFINRFDQIKGQAFLQAFENLKGGGQITEVEGRTATQAINRMNRATSASEFDAAANDLKSVIQAAKDRAIKKAGGGSGQGPATPGITERTPASSRYQIEVVE